MIEVYRGWWKGHGTLEAIRESFTYGQGDNRATGYLYAEGQPWPAALAESGLLLLDRLAEFVGVHFTVVAFQAYRNGSGCGWHADTAFDAQAILSLGVSRTFGTRRADEEPTWTPLDDGDLVVMPPGFQQEWEHCIPEEAVLGERCSLVFRSTT